MPNNLQDMTIDLDYLLKNTELYDKIKPLMDEISELEKQVSIIKGEIRNKNGLIREIIDTYRNETMYKQDMRPPVGNAVPDAVNQAGHPLNFKGQEDYPDGEKARKMLKILEMHESPLKIPEIVKLYNQQYKPETISEHTVRIYLARYRCFVNIWNKGYIFQKLPS